MKDTFADYFDWIPVVNLDRRPERWEAFQARYNTVTGWPFIPAERYAAVDGKVTGAPNWFTAGAPAWGCAQSHIHILETAMQAGMNRILVLEDDAVFCEGFSEEVCGFFSALPDNWDQAYVGGQHLRQRVRKPAVVNKQVLRAFNVNRTHGYALQRKFFSPLYAWLTNYVAWSAVKAAHIDHHMGRLHETRRHNIYAPVSWLVGQADGPSDITFRSHPVRFWGLNEEAAGLKPFVAIIGVHRSGSSMLAWILQKLGVHMGNNLNGNCEADGLQKLCEAAYPFGTTTLRGPEFRLLNALRDHVQQRSVEAKHRNTVAGGKYPHLCAMSKELMDACKWGLKIIHIDRPLEDSIASLKTRVRGDSKRGIKWLGISEEAAEDVQRWLYREKAKYFDGRISEEHILHVNYYDILEHPKEEIQRIIDFVGIKAGPANMAAACQVVQPKRRKHANGRYIGAGKQ